jgi:uncharacterized protein
MIRIGRAGSAAAALVAMLMAALLSAMAASAAEQQKQPAADKKQHQLVLQVNVNDPAMMNLALNNATNVAQYYKDLGEAAKIEVVTFGPGLHMLRDDTSPVKARIKTITESNPTISFQGLRQHPAEHAEGREQGHCPHSRGDRGEVRRRARHGVAGTRLDLCKALTAAGL